MLNKRLFAVIWLGIILSTIAFIFAQSSLPREASQAESDAVGDIVEEIIPSDTPTGAYVQKNLRKIAHFVEFAALGFEIAIFVTFFIKRKAFVAISYPFALIIALFDESIQMFSRRGPAIFDVWIDFFGFFVFASITYAVYFIAVYLFKWLKKVETSNGKNNRS